VNFLKLIRKYWSVNDLNAALLNDLIDSIVVHDPTVKYSRANRSQRVDIH
jgi:hypothetical protein